ncbi:hypothetical protein K431DRAFT_287533 [Polychaeton citri CBS 116435]|uniref:Uncharacterized protein n=1 Tax=Polychaeton citri CBS 116435 TaxID=1314669 RepID=A0A9P4Q5R2_9PEZI|nr:hypothetical protein K431DRAFT_287533 [Polychaeton citri CBS 116435]
MPWVDSAPTSGCLIHVYKTRLVVFEGEAICKFFLLKNLYLDRILANDPSKRSASAVSRGIPSRPKAR